MSPVLFPNTVEPLTFNEPVITASPTNVKEPVTSNDPLTSVFALVYSKFTPLDATLINLPAFAEVIPAIPLPTEKCALPDVVSSKITSALFTPTAFIDDGIITSSFPSYTVTAGYCSPKLCVTAQFVFPVD
jgi:hypothetical protein